MQTAPVKASSYRFIFWPLWFIVVPLGLALLSMKLLMPAEGSTNWFAEQKVPAVIILFTLYEMVLYHFRHMLPGAGHFAPGGGTLSQEMRRSYEHAGQLIDETERMLKKHRRAITEQVSEDHRTKIDKGIEALRSSMKAEPIDEASFRSAYERLNSLVAAHLGRWQRGELREYTESILIAVGAALLLRAFVVEAFKIPSGSMLPTLQIHDHIFVNKFAYGPNIPFTRSRLYDGLPPTRGDVMVFEFPDPNPINPRQDFIKRVIALPGDTLEVEEGRPRINGWDVPNCFVGEYEGARLFVEFLGDYSYLTLYDAFEVGSGSKGPYHVKEGEVWVLGDNRNNSHDSRAWNQGRGGGVPFANIKGRAMFVWLSFRDGGSAWDITWDRLFTNVMGVPEIPNHPPPALSQKLKECLNNRPGDTVAPDP